MLNKRKIVFYLNECEDKEFLGETLRQQTGGVARTELINHILLSEGSDSSLTKTLIDKLIDDCIEDEWIGVKTTSFPVNPLTFNGESEMNVNYFYVKSKGRDMLNWGYFIPKLLEKLSLKEIGFFAFTTGITILLGYLGIRYLK